MWYRVTSGTIDQSFSSPSGDSVARQAGLNLCGMRYRRTAARSTVTNNGARKGRDSFFFRVNSQAECARRIIAVAALCPGPWNATHHYYSILSFGGCEVQSAKSGFLSTGRTPRSNHLKTGVSLCVYIIYVKATATNARQTAPKCLLLSPGRTPSILADGFHQARVVSRASMHTVTRAPWSRYLKTR